MFPTSDIISDPPVSGSVTFTSTDLTFSWSSSSNSACVSHYSVNVTSIDSYTISTTDTSLILPIPSLNDTEYSISVAAVTFVGRSVEGDDDRTFIADGK